MILTDRDIKLALEHQEINIEGVKDPYIGPASVDLHLDNRARYSYSHTAEKIDTSIDNDHLFGTDDGWEKLMLLPGAFYILSTIEVIGLNSQHAGFVHGRSSLARLGLNIHMAGFVDPGFKGNITLEVTNFTNLPIVLHKGMRIGQIVFMKAMTPAAMPYNLKYDSKYHGQSGPTLSRIEHDS